MNKKLIELFGGEIRYIVHDDEIYTTSLFWDCECQWDYIHPVTKTCCEKCNAISGEQSNSRINEVVLYAIDLYNMED